MIAEPTDDDRLAYPLSPALEFLAHLWMLNHAVERVSSRMERSLGISAQQRLVLRCAGKFPGITAGQLALVLHLDRGTVSASLRRLELKGLLRRSRDPRDKRRINISLTARGRTIDRPMNHSLEDAVERLLKVARPMDVTATRTVLRALTDLLSVEPEHPSA